MLATDDSSRQTAQDVGGSRALPLMTRDEIEALIASGRHIIIHRGYVLRLDSWLQYHPGGAKAIMHLVGRDATDWVDVYVDDSSSTTHALNELLMPAFFSVYIPRKQKKKCRGTALAELRVLG